MGRTYFALLRAIEARRFDVFDRRVTLPAPRRVVIALRCWLASAGHDPDGMTAAWGVRGPFRPPQLKSLKN